MDYCDVFIRCLKSHSDGTHSKVLTIVNGTVKEPKSLRGIIIVYDSIFLVVP